MSPQGSPPGPPSLALVVGLLVVVGVLLLWLMIMIMLFFAKTNCSVDVVTVHRHRIVPK